MNAPEILYADNHLLAVNKPAGWLTQATEQAEHLNNVEDWAREYVRIEKQKTGNVFVHALHRLDRVVSGVVLLARTSKALERLNETIRRQQWHKLYRAIVERKPQPVSGELCHFLCHEHRHATVVSPGTPGAKEARLVYTWLARENDLHLLNIALKTGRYHQIRVQLAAMGTPIVGDARYGSTASWFPNAIALHHTRLELEHPTTRNILCIEAPMPTTWPSFHLP